MESHGNKAIVNLKLTLITVRLHKSAYSVAVCTASSKLHLYYCSHHLLRELDIQLSYRALRYMYSSHWGYTN